MKIFIMLNFLFSALYLLSTSPINFMVLIMIQSILICLITWVMIKTSWFSFILFLIFLGGLMVLFIYITSLASNEKLSINLNEPKNNIYPLIFLLGALLIFSLGSQVTLKENMVTLKSFNHMFSQSLSSTTMFVMVYLLLTLIIAVKISNKSEGPIKSLI